MLRRRCQRVCRWNELAAGGVLIVLAAVPGSAWGQDAVPRLWPAMGRGGFGYMDERGAFVIPPTFEQARNFKEGLACVQVNGKWGYIDQRGVFVLPPQFTWAYDFSDGMAQAGRGLDKPLEIWKMRNDMFWSTAPIATARGVEELNRMARAERGTGGQEEAPEDAVTGRYASSGMARPFLAMSEPHY